MISLLFLLTGLTSWALAADLKEQCDLTQNLTACRWYIYRTSKIFPPKWYYCIKSYKQSCEELQLGHTLPSGYASLFCEDVYNEADTMCRTDTNVTLFNMSHVSKLSNSKELRSETLLISNSHWSGKRFWSADTLCERIGRLLTATDKWNLTINPITEFFKEKYNKNVPLRLKQNKTICGEDVWETNVRNIIVSEKYIWQSNPMNLEGLYSDLPLPDNVLEESILNGYETQRVVERPILLPVSSLREEVMILLILLFLVILAWASSAVFNMIVNCLTLRKVKGRGPGKSVLIYSCCQSLTNRYLYLDSRKNSESGLVSKQLQGNRSSGTYDVPNELYNNKQHDPDIVPEHFKSREGRSGQEVYEGRYEHVDEYICSKG